MIAKMPTIAAMAYKYTIGQPFIYPRNDVDYASNFLRMCFAVPAEDYEVNPILSRAMDRIFTLHADHEQNASTSTVRLASSSGANPFACIAAGHRLSLGTGPWWRQPGLPRNAPRDRDRGPHPRIHRPRQGQGRPLPPDGLRSPRLQEFRPAREGDETIRRRGSGTSGFEDNPTLQVAKELEKQALEDEYFAEKKLFPNVDFYSGIILEAMGFPTSMFTPIFAVSRTIGWISQWKEMIADPQLKIGRPRQLYQGCDRARLRGYRKPLSYFTGQGWNAPLCPQRPRPLRDRSFGEAFQTPRKHIRGVVDRSEPEACRSSALQAVDSHRIGRAASGCCTEGRDQRVFDAGGGAVDLQGLNGHLP